MGDEGGKVLSFLVKGCFLGFLSRDLEFRLGFVDARMSLGVLASFLSSCDI